MNFKRNRAQLLCEQLLGCQDPDSWAQNRNNFESYSLTQSDQSILANCLCEDSKDFYYKGLLSLSEAINSIDRRLYSWSTVKLYYSVYYFLRCTMAIRRYAVIRNQQLYILKAAVGAKPHKKNNRRYNSTHQGTINHFIDLFKSRDKLQDNQIDGVNPYVWLMNRRDQIHYRERSFHDPDCSDFWEEISKYVVSGNIGSLLELYISDSKFLYCFQEDHACLALPIKRAILTKEDIDKARINLNLEKDKGALIKKLLKVDKLNLIELECLLA